MCQGYANNVFFINNEQQLDGLKKPPISFYSRKQTIKSLLALEPVKNEIRAKVRNGNTVAVYKIDKGFGIEILPYDYNSHNCYGIKMLRHGLDEMELATHNYTWLLALPVAGIVTGSLDFLEEPFKRIRLADRVQKKFNEEPEK